MNTALSNFYLLYKTKIIVGGLILLVMIVGGFFVFNKKEIAPDFIIMERGDITQEVSVTGKVKPSQKVELAFEVGGKISNSYVNVADRVSKGQILARIENTDIYASLAQAEANFEAEKAKLDQLKKGMKPEEIDVYEAKMEGAYRSLEDARRNLLDKMRDAYVRSDDAIRNRVDQFMSNPRGLSPQINFTTDYKMENDIELGRADIERVLMNWQTSLSVSFESTDTSSLLDLSENNLNIVINYLNLVSIAVNSLTASANLSQTTINNYKTDIASARTNINTAIANLSSADESLRDAESAYTISKRELDLARTGSTEEQIRGQEAIVKSTRASIDNYWAQISKRIIISPMSGIVTRQDAKVGEIVSVNTTVISLISDREFEIEVNIPEADIAKVKLSDKANVTLDAYGDSYAFEAEVISIDPAETIVEGVSVYKTALRFLNEDGKIKSGMTANVDIITDRKDSVIKIPQRYVIGKNGDRMVKILKSNGLVEERNVKIGIIDNNGYVEIVDGVKEGDKIVNPS